MSFPLGFTDLYTHLGSINASSINDCTSAENGCLREKYDFATTNNTDHGSSGSPLIAMTGEVIGVVEGGTDGRNANFTWGIDAFLLSEF
jgi:S1-C subfamily serine protease